MGVVAALLLNKMSSSADESGNGCGNVYAETAGQIDLLCKICDAAYVCIALSGYDGPSGLGAPKNATPF